MIATPNITATAYSRKIDRIIIEFVMIYMMDFERSSEFFSSYAASLAGMIIAIPNHAFEFLCKFRAIRESRYSAVPGRMTSAGILLGDKLKSFFSVFLAIKRIVGSKHRFCFIGFFHFFYSFRSVLPSFFSLINSFIVFESGSFPFGNRFLGLFFAFVRSCCPWCWLSFVPCNLSFFPGARVRIVPLLIVSWFSLRCNWRDHRSAPTLTFNFRQGLSFLCLLCSIFALPFIFSFGIHLNSIPCSRRIVI